MLSNRYIKVDAEFGLASDSGWSDGKIVSKATWKHLASRFGSLERPSQVPQMPVALASG